jgi:hypothetical protein
MLESICDSKACGKAENSTIVFWAFHKPSFSRPALLWLCCQGFWRTVEVDLIGRERIQAGMRPGGVIEIDVASYLRPNFLH